MYPRFFNFLIPSLLLCTQLALAQQYPVRTYTLRDGLPQMQVMCSLLDSRGYLWLGTKNGLAKFDGEHFETYSRQDFGLNSTQIQCLAEDSQHQIWILTSQGLVRFNGATFRAYPFPKNIPNSPLGVCFDGQNRAWITGDRLGRETPFFYFQHGRYHPAATAIPGIARQPFITIHWDKHLRRLWLLTKQIGPDNTTRLWYVNDRNQCQPTAYRPPPESIHANFFDAHERLLIQEVGANGNANYIIPRIDSVPMPFLEVRRGQWRVVRPANFTVYLMDNTRPGPVMAYRSGADKLEFITANTHSSVSRAGMVRDQKVYFGTEKGLLEVTDNGLRYFNEAQAPNVWSVAQAPNGAIWWFNYGGAPPRQFANGQVATLREPGLNTLWRRMRPTQSDRWNNYYFHPTYGPGNALYLPHELGLARYQNAAWSLVPNQAMSLYAYADGATNRVFSAVAGGFNVLEGQRTVRKLTQAEGFHPCGYGLAAIADPEPGVYWLGSGRGLSRYTYQTNTFEHFLESNGKLPTRGVCDFCLDGRGTVWMAGRSGLCRYDRKSGKVLQVAGDVLKNAVGFVGLLTDSTLAIGDTYGVYLLDLVRYYATGDVVMRLLNHRTGYMGIEPGQAGFFKDRQGRAWITSGTVLSYIDTRLFSYKPQPLRPILRSLNKHRLPFAYADSVFVLPENQATACITFEVLGDNRPADTQYTWQLDNEPWTAWQTEPNTTLRDYDGGTHTFRLKARNGGINEATDQIATLQFRADIAWFNDSSFKDKLPYTLFLLLFIGLILVVYLADERKQAQRVKQQLAEREREAQILNSQTLQSQLNTHFVFNALTPVQNLILQNKQDEAAQLLVEFARLVRSLLDSSATSNDASPANREITLADEIDLLRRYISFEKLLYRDKITVHFGDDSIDGKLDPQQITLPPMLIQPFVENAIKHGLVHKNGDGNLWVRFVGVGEALICTVEDDGIGRQGMRQIQQQSIRTYQSRGTTLVKQRIDFLNKSGYAITIDATDRVGGGTVVTISIDRHEPQPR